MSTRLLPTAALFLSLTFAAGCGHRIAPNFPDSNPAPQTMGNDTATPPMTMHHETPWASVTDAVAVLYPTKGNAVSGTLHFTALPDDGGLHIHGTITGLDPNSTHAFHIHEFGDASAPDGMSAGGHFNPEHHQHGGPDSPEHHAGDLGNITADASGTATVDITAPGLSIAGMKDPILGRSVVLHAKTDDFVTQPTGNAGGRIAVGIIGIAK
jgi:Cu-Zn family superoxide dismutase